MKICHILSITLFLGIASYGEVNQAPNFSNTNVKASAIPSNPNNPVIKLGDSKELVDKLLGTSKGWKSDNEETAYYERGYVRYVDGKAVRWSLLNNEELAVKKSAGSKDLKDSQQSEAFKPKPLTPEELAIREKQSQQQKAIEQEELTKQIAIEQEKSNQRKAIEQERLIRQKSIEQEELSQRKKAEDERLLEGEHTKIVAFLEHIVLSRQIPLSSADLLRADFIESINAKRVTSKVLLEWASDPIEWRKKHYYEIQNAGSSNLSSDNPSCQCLQYALNRFDARQDELAKKAQQKIEDQLSYILLNRVLNPRDTSDYMKDMKINQIQSDIEQIKINQSFRH